MTISQTTRFDLYRWSEDTDAFTRSQMDTSHANIEERAARFLSGTTIPASAAEYARSFFYKTDTETLYYYDAEDGTGEWVALSASDPIAALITAKGDIIGGTGSGTADNLSVGANGTRLIADSSTPTGLSWVADTQNTVVDARGDLLAGTADNTVARLAAGANNSVLVANSAQATGLQWSTTLSGLTLTGPSTTNALLSHPREQWTVSATAASGTVNLSVLAGSAWLYTSNSTANWTLNVRGDASTTLNSLLANNESITVAFASTNGTTAFRHTAMQIDGVSVTPRWQGGTAPTAGNASSIDVYTFTIIKTASATYTVLGAQTRFA